MLRMGKILLPVSFSDRCRGAGRYAEALARQFGSTITLLHVVAHPFAAYGGPEAGAYSSAADLLAQRLSMASDQLETFLSEELAGLEPERIVREGDPAQEIVALAREGSYDLILMPTHGYGPFRRFLLGSVTAKVLHDAECPVWTGPHMESAPPREVIHIRKIVCALDLGPHSRAVLGWATEAARAFCASLGVVHVVPMSEVRLGAAYFDPEWRTELAKAARKQACWLIQELQTAADVRVETGEIAASIASAARDMQADLVVAGRSHRVGLGRLGTHAYNIIRESPCAVAGV